MRTKQKKLEVFCKSLIISTIFMFTFSSNSIAQDQPWPGLNVGTLACPATPSVSGNTSGANVDCGVSTSGDHIYRFTLAQAMDVTFDVCGASWDTQLHLFNLANGNCNAGSIATNDDACGLQSRITMTCLAAGTYVIVVEGFGSSTGAYTLNVATSNCGCPPPNSGTNDCAGGTTVCNSQAFSGNSTGEGVEELNATNRGCFSATGEHQSSWYFFETTSAGNLAFTISPQNGTDDYDFAVWGPYPSGSTPNTICPPNQAPLRCSWAAGGGNTGLLNGALDNSEGAGGDKFVEDIVAGVGEVYILLVDNFSTSLSPFDLNWNLTNGASLDCTPLPVVLSHFSGESLNDGNRLYWTTESEVNNNYFNIERSIDGINFQSIGKVAGNGNSNTFKEYTYTDLTVTEDYYYRLKQYDFNGNFEFSNSVFIKNKTTNEVNVFPNPTSGTLNIEFKNTNSRNYTVIVSNIVGVSFSTKINLSANNNTIQLDEFNQLANGFYTVKIIDETNSLVKNIKVLKR